MLDLMRCSAYSSKMSDPDGLPAEVIQALEISAVHATKTLQGISGLGLYEAKLVVDAYLERHPGHALSQRSASSSVVPRDETAGAMLEDFANAAPVLAKAPVFDSLEMAVAPPELYVLLREGVPCKGWFGEALKACVDAGLDTARVEILDEESRIGNDDVSAAVLKLSGKLSNEALRILSESLGRRLAQGISIRLVRAVQWSEAAIPSDELELEYFQHEFSRQSPSPRVWKTTSSVWLRHRTTGIVSRSTVHRRQATNYQEALLLLASLLKECR